MDDHLGELHDGSDHQDEGNDAQVAEAERRQQPMFDVPADRRGEDDDEGGGHAHAQGAVDAFRDAHERAQAEKLDEHHVIDEGGGDQQEEIVAHGFSLAFAFSLSRTVPCTRCRLRNRARALKSAP